MFQYYLDDPNPPHFDGGMSAAGYSNHGWHHEGIVKDPLGIDISDSMCMGSTCLPGSWDLLGMWAWFQTSDLSSPLEHTLVANPLYGEHRNMNPLQLGEQEWRVAQSPRQTLIVVISSHQIALVVTLTLKVAIPQKSLWMLLQAQAWVYRLCRG